MPATTTVGTSPEVTSSFRLDECNPGNASRIRLCALEKVSSGRAPGMFFSLAVTPPGVDEKRAVNHSPLFEGDDRALPIGVRLMSSVALDYLRGGTRL